MELIYHDEKITGNKEISRFSEILGEIGNNSRVDIVAPYVSPDMLDRHFYGCKIRLLSDFDECFRMLTKDRAKELQSKIKRAPDNFRHIAGIHAKVFIGENKALVGSANLTQMGLCKRREMAVLFDEPETIAELGAWFDNLWKNGFEVSFKTMGNIIKELPSKRVEKKPKHRFESKAPKINLKLIPAKKIAPEIEQEEIVIERLKDRIRRAPSREWIEVYFELAKKAIDILGNAEEDERVVFSCPESDYLSLQINRRVIIATFPNKGLFLFIGSIDNIGRIQEQINLFKIEDFKSMIIIYPCYILWE